MSDALSFLVALSMRNVDSSQSDAPNHNSPFAFTPLIETIARFEPSHILAQDVKVDAYFRCIDDTRPNLPLCQSVGIMKNILKLTARAPIVAM
jgi:hypothetical protein